MFGKNKRLERRLREVGKSAPAEVVNARPGHAIEHGDPVVPGNVEIEWKLELVVRPDGEEEFTAEATARSGHLPRVITGQVLTVLYDPEDHRSVVVDTQAAERDRDALIARARERAAEQRQSSVAPESPSVPTPAGTPDRVELLAKLAKLHEDGSLTDEEFAAEKKLALGSKWLGSQFELSLDDAWRAR